jgi:signal transduction histidine kinase
MTDIIGLINLLSGIAQLALGFFVLASDFKNRVKRYYFLSVFFLGCWSLSIFFYSNPIILDTTTWLKIVYTMAYGIILGLILFARVFPKTLKKKFRIFFILTAVYMAVIGFFMWTTDYMIVYTYHLPETFNSIAKMGPLYFWYALPAFIASVYIVGYYINKARILRGVEKRQVQLYVIGGICFLIPVMIFDFFLPLVFEDTSFYKHGTLGNAIWPIIVAYAILTTRFLDIRVVVGSVLNLFLKSLILLLALILVMFVIEPLWQISFSVLGVLKIFLLSFFLTLIFGKAFTKIEEFLAEKFVYYRYNPVKSLRILSNKISQTVDLGKIVNHFLELIFNSFEPKFLSLILLNQKNQILLNEQRGSKTIETSKILEILDVWRKLNSNRILIYSELSAGKRVGKRIIDHKRDTILEFMKRNKIEIIFSLKEESKFDGVVLLGQKHNGDSYTVGDIDFLDSVMQNLHMALVRSTLYLELQNFNQNLQQKVDEQTKELNLKVEQLEEARRKERDMIDIMGHELRTPASIVTANVDLLEQWWEENSKYIQVSEKVKKKIFGEYKTYIARMKEGSQREGRLINVLLESAKIDGNSLSLNKESLDIGRLIEKSINTHEGELKRKKLNIKYKNNLEKNITVFADQVRLFEVIDNLLDNAIKYTNKGGVTIVVKKKDELVQVVVQDTGLGIPEDSVKKLGQKFYRVDQYLRDDEGKKDKLSIVRPGGTGLGLYVVFGIVKEHGGDIFVESKEGSGTKISFTIPIYEDSDKKDVAQEESKDIFERFGLKKGNK